jgi:hypothetical protein
MRKVKITFQILNGYEEVPPMYEEIRCHMIFDLKMEDFCCKARLVSGGHTTDIPHIMTYASVVSQELVKIALTLAALNDLDDKMSGI